MNARNVTLKIAALLLTIMVGNAANAQFQKEEHVIKQPTANNGSNSVGNATSLRISSAMINNSKQQNVQMHAYATANKLTVHFETEATGVVNVALFDLSGRQVFYSQHMEEAGKHVQNINIDRVPSGTYVVRVGAGDKMLTQKVFIR